MHTYTPFLIVDTLDTATPGLRCLAAMETGTLPDGCHAYVLSNRTLYVLEKTTNFANTGGLVAAVNGGNWVPVSGIGSSFSTAAMRNTAGSNKAITLTGVGNFLPMPSAGGTFAAEYTGGNWNLNTSSGQLTYLGPSGQPFLLNAVVSAYESVTVDDVTMGVNKTGVVLDFQTTVSAPVATGSSSFFSMSLTGALVMNQNDTLDLQFAGEASTLTLTRISLAVTPLY